VATDVEGLTGEQAAARLAEDGRNELPLTGAPSLWRQLFVQMFHFFALLLWGAGVLAVIAGMPSLGVAIFLVVITNGLFAFFQEYRAERAARRLQGLLPRRALVRRDGAWIEVDAAELVVGDLLTLGAGDRVCADASVLWGRGLRLDTSLLTGESAAVAVEQGEAVFAGTFVVEGEARVRVVATGRALRVSEIAVLTQHSSRPPTPLAQELDRLVRVIAVVALSGGAVFLVLGLVLGLSPREGFLFAIGVTVALVPEGLLPTVTLSLALGATRMANHGALVRRLDAVQALGSTTFVCSDKTGTLTANQMTAIEVWTPSGRCSVRGDGYAPEAEIDGDDAARAAASRLALAAARCSSGRVVRRDRAWVPRGDPMEAALHALALRFGNDVDGDERPRPEIVRFPFDPHRRRMSVVAGDRVWVKGAPDATIGLCSTPGAAAEIAAEMSTRGLRVLAVAERAAPKELGDDAASIETELELLGLVGLLDPPRPEVRRAIERCHAAGMRIAMVTGDHAGTARAIAERVGLRADLVVRGDELPADDEELGALVDRDGVIACRVSPEQKLRIAKALQQRGHVVAMTGDGVNDAPALRQADVGVAMGKSGTDVARAAADLVLLDDRFETIVLAIEQGRASFANIRRFLTYHLTDNVAELMPFAVWALSGGRFPLALGVLQVLCLDLLTDQLPALALSSEPPSRKLSRGRMRDPRLIDKTLLIRAFAVFGPVEAVLSLSAFTAVLLELGWSPGSTPSGPALRAASGAAFTAVVVGQAATALACRSVSRPALRVSLSSNPLIPVALLVTWALVASLLYVPGLARLLGHGPPTPLGYLVASAAFPAVLLADWALKSRRHTARD
jgi:calcium-translocating P-type ATPase